MPDPSNFTRSLEYRNRTRSDSRSYDHLSQQVADAIERNDQKALQALMNQNNSKFKLTDMTNKLKEVVDNYIGELPQSVSLNLPKLKKVDDNSNSKLKLPKLKKV